MSFVFIESAVAIPGLVLSAGILILEFVARFGPADHLAASTPTAVTAAPVKEA